MARITRVKRAQQRYAMVPVLDAQTGQPKQVPVMLPNGEQKTTKHGRPVFMKITIRDRSKPLPDRVCDSCQEPIPTGTPYKHVTPHGRATRNRHAGCPDWQPWELSDSLSAQLSRVAADLHAEVSDADSVEAVQDALNSAAEAVREIASAKEEAAQNMEDGFGHETEPSQNLRDQAEQLNSWADDDIENLEIPDLPEPEAEDRWYVINKSDGTHVFEDAPEGDETEDEARDRLAEYVRDSIRNGRPEDPEEFDVIEEEYTPEEPTEEQMDDWRGQVEDAIAVIDEPPVS